MTIPLSSRTRRALAVAIAAVAVTLVAATWFAPPPASARPPTPFHVVPDPLPYGEPGAVIKSEVAHDTATVRTIRVMYHSRSLAGADIAVTGRLHVPRIAAAPPGGRDVVTAGHGTAGTADGCAPSISSGYDYAAFNELLELGHVVAETDYEGLGTPGIHPHLVGDSEARSMIDIVRAARNLPETQASARYVATGVSQGGHGALFVGEIAASWAPELELLGVNAESPGTEMPLAARFLSTRRDPYSAANLLITAVGIGEAYPEAALEQVMTPLGLSLVPLAEELCFSALVTEIAARGVDQALFQAIEPPEPWASLFVAIDPGHRPTSVPIRIYQGGLDLIVPPFLTAALHVRLCGLGAAVVRDVFPTDGHGGGSRAARDATHRFVVDRFAGIPFASDCPASTEPLASDSSAGAPMAATPATAVAAEPTFTG